MESKRKRDRTDKPWICVERGDGGDENYTTLYVWDTLAPFCFFFRERIFSRWLNGIGETRRLVSSISYVLFRAYFPAFKFKLGQKSKIERVEGEGIFLKRKPKATKLLFTMPADALMTETKSRYSRGSH